ncbi:anhydro-N-acetylmuramic acid kinase [Algibacter marinivivus]|uniref:Anhydro-N-acetylmuramic acid kinase n=1 Tax=Algibacter marinivivus TaxID=2100723 RepID=A0A2U2X6T6_9FLAO|nr:anhydro-N-acetylmuramic acid kinase [Algibacter marinivivus]PWH83474.1 anhydro-N-acetylmuramic acid kinase [Algibacter marinivivus]
MSKSKYSVIGVMSGTSLDGIDLVYANFYYDEVWGFEIVYAETIKYDAKWFNILKRLVSFSFEELKNIDANYTEYLANVIKGFINKNQIKHIDAVCSHGHTALHQPENKLTYQIGNRPLLAKILNEKVVCDFRVQDVEHGGQGAPLVPIGDELLFSEYDFCLNLGGFANISMHLNNERIAYDICPVNIVMNHYVNKLGFDYDDRGGIASTGTINENLLNQLNKLDFYKENYPKSLGLEWVNRNVFPIINNFQLETKTVLRTFLEHIAYQIASEIKKIEKATVLITGGGVYNTFLIERIKHLSNTEIIIPSNNIVEFKEALIFGFLGVLKIRNEVNCLKSVTGASKDHSSGRIYLP